MPINKAVASAGAVDSSAEVLVPKFARATESGNSWEGSNSWWASEVNLNLGTTPGRATINIPINAGVVDEVANRVAFDPDVVKEFKIGQRTSVEKRWTDANGKQRNRVVFVGYISHVSRDRGADALVLTAQDIRWRMKEVYIVGRYITNPEASSPVVSYQQGWAAHFNPGGRPNCLFTDDPTAGSDALAPVFSPYPDFGIAPGETVPPPEDAPQSRATYWTLSNILQYLRIFWGPAATFDTNWPWLQGAPVELTWPEGLGSEIDKESVQVFDQAQGQANQNKGTGRKGRDIVLEGVSLLDALELLFSTAGGWSLAISAKSEDSDEEKSFTSVMSAVNTRFKGKGQKIPYAGADQPAEGKALITGGSFLEDGDDYVSGMAGRSSLVFVEKRFDTQTADSFNASHDVSRFDSWRKAILSLGNNAEAFREANILHPEVVTTWNLDADHDLYEGTGAVGKPLAAISRPPLPRQLSFMEVGASSDFAGLAWPVYLEVLVDGVFEIAGLFDGFGIFETGVVEFPAVRELGAPIRSWEAISGPGDPPFDTSRAGTGTVDVVNGSKTINGTDSKFKDDYSVGATITVDGVNSTVDRVLSDTELLIRDEYTGSDKTGEAHTTADGGVVLRARNVRFNFSIPTDHGISFGFFLANDKIGSDIKNAEVEVIDPSPDAERIEPNFSRRKYIDFQTLYQLWYRRKSFPNPQSAGASQFVDKPGTTDPGGENTNALRDDLAFLKSHAGRRLYEEGRIRKGGPLEIKGYLATEYIPGMAVEALQSNDATKNMPANAVIDSVKLKSQRGEPPATATEIMPT